MVLWITLVLAVLLPQPQRPQADPVAPLLVRLEQLAAAGDHAGVLGLSSNGVDLEEFAAALTRPAPTRIVIRARDRTTQGTNRQRVLLEIFAERGREALAL